MKIKYKYIRFEKINKNNTEYYKRKTDVFICINRDDEELGTVEWFSRWRQYCFEPSEGMIFTRSCLADINDFIKQLMDERKAK